MDQEIDEKSLIQKKELILRESLGAYLTAVRLQMENMDKRERILRNLIAEQKAGNKETISDKEKISRARGILVKELVKRDPEVVRSLLIPVIKELGLTKEEARRVLGEIPGPARERSPGYSRCG